MRDRDLRVTMTVEQLWQKVPGGSGTYIVELLRAAHDLPGIRFRGLSASHGPHSAHEVPRVQVPVSEAHLPRRALYDAWNYLERPRAETVVPGSDVVHATTWAIPGTRLPLVVTVHDLAFLRAPEHFTRRGAAFFRRALRRTRDRADRVVVPSESTADDCVQAGIGRDRIRVIPHGVTVREVTDADQEDFRRRHGLNSPFVLWCGTREPRKNLAGLLAAFREVAGRVPDLHLALVGPQGWGDASPDLGPPDVAGRVHSLGRLDDNDLACAYRAARVFCFPSSWEGFGLPVLEAMAYGTPVVTSSGTSMAEVVGSAGLLVPYDSPTDIASGILRAAGEDHDLLASAALTRAKDYSWRASAVAHRDVYTEAVRAALRRIGRARPSHWMERGRNVDRTPRGPV